MDINQTKGETIVSKHLLRFEGNDQGAVVEAWSRLHKLTGGALYEPPYGPSRIKWPVVHAGLDSVSRRRIAHFISWYARLYGVALRDVVDESTSSVDHFLDALLDWHHSRQYHELHIARCIDDATDEDEQLALADAARQVLRRQGDQITADLRTSTSGSATGPGAEWTSMIERPRCRVRFDRRSSGIQVLISCSIPAGNSYLDVQIGTEQFNPQHSSTIGGRKVFTDIPMGLGRASWPRQATLTLNAEGAERRLSKRLPRCPFDANSERGLMVCDHEGVLIERPLIADEPVVLVGAPPQLGCSEVRDVFDLAPIGVQTNDGKSLGWSPATVRALDVTTADARAKVRQLREVTGSRIELEEPPPIRFSVTGRRAWIGGRAPLRSCEELHVRLFDPRIEGTIEVVHLQGARQTVLANPTVTPEQDEMWIRVEANTLDAGALIVRSDLGWRSRAIPIAPATLVDTGRWVPLSLEADVVGEMSGGQADTNLAVGISARSISGTPIVLTNEWGQFIVEEATNEQGECWNATLSTGVIGASVTAVDCIGELRRATVGHEPYVSRTSFQLRNGKMTFLVRIPEGVATPTSEDWAAVLVDDAAVPAAVKLDRFEVAADRDMDGEYLSFNCNAPTPADGRRWSWAVVYRKRDGHEDLQAVQSLGRDPAELVLTNKDISDAMSSPSLETMADVARLVERRQKPAFITPTFGARLGSAILAQVAKDNSMAMIDLFFSQPTLGDAVREFGASSEMRRTLPVTLVPPGFSASAEVDDLELDGAPETTLGMLADMLNASEGRSLALSWGDDEVAWVNLRWDGSSCVLPPEAGFVQCAECNGIFPDTAVWELHSGCVGGQPNPLTEHVKLTPTIHWAFAIPCFLDALVVPNDAGLLEHQQATYARLVELLGTDGVAAADLREVHALATAIASVLTALPVGGPRVSSTALASVRQFAREPLPMRQAAFSLIEYPMAALKEAKVRS